MPTPAKRPDSDKESPVVEAVISVLNSRVATFAPGTVVGAGVYLQTGQVRQALLACVLGPPAVTAGKVLSEWVKLLAPPRHIGRPRRRGG